MLRTLDLFCGCGGLSLGFKQAGFDIVAGIDNDPEALQTFSLNFKNSTAFCTDISKNSEILFTSPDQLEQLKKKHVRLTAEWTEQLVCVLSDQLEEANTYLKFTN